MREVMLAAILLRLCAGPLAARPMDLAFIDHYNLRYTYQSDEPQLRSQVAAIKVNMDRAADYDVRDYVLFSRSFEYLVNYDFALDGVGDLSEVVWPMDSEHRRLQRLYAQCLDEVLDYARNRGISVIFHTNQFDFPDKLYEMAGGRMAGSARVCPGKPLPYQALKQKVAEFFRRFPGCAGLQLTMSETQVKVTECECDSCAALNADERFRRVVEAVADVCVPLGKSVSVRTWGGFGDGDGAPTLPEGVICSGKNTSGDFRLCNGASSDMADGNIGEVEFDAWGEYAGHNLFPCYKGGTFAERVRLYAKAGGTRLAARLNWNGSANPLFDRPFGNLVNLYVLGRLAQAPDADPDSLLRDYIDRTYPVSAREAAFRLYKRSEDLQKAWMTWDGDDANDHSRVIRGWSIQTYADRTKSCVGRPIPDSYAEALPLVEKRRLAIDNAYEEAKELIAALGPDVPADWKRELERGARGEWFVAHGVSDCVLMTAAYSDLLAGRPLPDLSELEAGIERRARLWSITDAKTMDLMLGNGVPDMLKHLKAAAQAESKARD